MFNPPEVLLLLLPFFDSGLTCCLFQDRDGYWKMMQKYIGSDITSMVTLPVVIFEPMTMLQKMAEVLSLLLFHCLGNRWPICES